MTETMTLTEKNNRAREILADHGEVLSYTQTLRLAWQVFSQPAKMAKFKGTPQEVRQEAQRRSHDFYNFCRSIGIDIDVQGVDTIEDADEIGLWLGNHNLFGFEAVNICDATSDTTRTMLKDGLLKIPFFGKGLAKFDPIVFNRKLKSGEALAETAQAQVDTIAQGGSVMIYPEGKRMGDELGPFKTVLYQRAYESIQQRESTKRRVGLITTDSAGLPFKLTPKVLKPNGVQAYKTPVHMHVETVEVNPEENIKEFNQRVRLQIQSNLARIADQRLEALAHS